jgi:hypothetical protein
LLLAGLFALLATGTALATFSSGIYKGKTSQGYALKFKVLQHQFVDIHTRDASVVTGLTFTGKMTCTDGDMFVEKRGPFNDIVVKNGKYSTTFANADGSSSTVLTGSLSKKHASGRIKRKVIFNTAGQLDPAGTVFCTANFSWTAKH